MQSCFCLSVCQLSEARDKTLEGLNRTVDYKELKGKDPSTVELVKKIEQVQHYRSVCAFVHSPSSPDEYSA